MDLIWSDLIYVDGIDCFKHESMYIYIFVEREKTFFRTTSVSTHYVFDGPMLKKTVLLHYVLPLRDFGKSKSAELCIQNRSKTFHDMVKVTCQVGLFLLEKKNRVGLFSQKNQSVSPWAYFHPQILWSVEFMGPKYSKNWCPRPGYIPWWWCVTLHPFSTLGKRACHVWQAACGPGKCPSCLVVAMRSRRGDGFTQRKRKKAHRLAWGEMCFSTMAWHEGLCFNHW